MNVREKIAVGVLFLILMILCGISVYGKDLSDFLFWYGMSRNQQMFSDELKLEQKLREIKPIRNSKIPDLEITAKSAISVLIDDSNDTKKERVLFEKESEEILPIASITKLMTAWVVLEHYDLSKEIVISKSAANQYGDIRKLEEGKTFSVKYLLYPLLMESSNAAAFALASGYEGITERNFVELMSLEAEKMGLNDTFFDNPTGLDPEESKTKINHSTANDLVKFVKRLLEKPLIWEILSLPRYSLYGPELINTNRLLLKENESSLPAEAQATGNASAWQNRIIGGKTGYTGEARGCLLLVVKAPKNQGFLISVILGANGRNDRFEEMEKLVDWLKTAYKW